MHDVVVKFDFILWESTLVKTVEEVGDEKPLEIHVGNGVDAFGFARSQRKLSYKVSPALKSQLQTVHRSSHMEQKFQHSRVFQSAVSALSSLSQVSVGFMLPTLD
ncbi:hypothetical protein M422DRAFT_260246 [Sphaerobolus stellatus SS14]|uniref:Uncharacterized protein n=1 Tax=Sphaerobolus stellatus (strain SS14) TaxID=990650 RepID=A0A0C9UR94_SPHS4|nr:hypothetical protein M422DRAFT_260244 [Sphaerobolus stellatus SS14]KIJ37299.1 hypothetical protein M422DRAFT_260246 [Sphaerobolus stellatus SS14]